MPRKISRRTFLKRAFGTLFTLIAAGTGGYYYAREIEPKLLEINRQSITHALIPRGFDQFKIVQFSDTHLGFQYSIEQLKKLIERINQLEPDIILFTGDLMDQPNKYEKGEILHRFYKIYRLLLENLLSMATMTMEATVLTCIEILWKTAALSFYRMNQEK